MSKCIKCNKIEANFGLHGGNMLYCYKCTPTIDNIEYSPHFEIYTDSNNNTQYCETSKEIITQIRDPKYINIKNINNLCITENCFTRASFNFKEKRAIYCSKCKDKNMVNVIHRRCKYCNKQPHFGKYKGKALYCKEHKRKTDVDVKHPRCHTCLQNGIDKTGNFYLENEPKQLFCQSHINKNKQFKRKYCSEKIKK